MIRYVYRVAIVLLAASFSACSSGSPPQGDEVDPNIERQWLLQCSVTSPELYTGGELTIAISLPVGDEPRALSPADLVVTGASIRVPSQSLSDSVVLTVGVGASPGARACVALHLLDPDGAGTYLVVSAESPLSTFIMTLDRMVNTHGVDYLHNRYQDPATGVTSSPWIQAISTLRRAQHDVR